MSQQITREPSDTSNAGTDQSGCFQHVLQPLLNILSRALCQCGSRRDSVTTPTDAGEPCQPISIIVTSPRRVPSLSSNSISSNNDSDISTIRVSRAVAKKNETPRRVIERTVVDSSSSRNVVIPRQLSIKASHGLLELYPTELIPINKIRLQLPNQWLKSSVNSVLRITPLESDDSVYQRIAAEFSTFYTRSLTLERIDRVENIYLWLMFQLKKEEYKRMQGYCSERGLFHGTKQINLDSICTNNFDWRRFGKNWGFRFGQGVSFSPRVSYASHYSDKNFGSDNKMIFARVLEARVAPADWQMKLPPQGYNTTVNDKNTVYVKYDDHAFYPEFIITYCGRL